ncbi:ABC transporter substrate-binding protein [Acidisphaera sp. S103]|uniref:ABC transporter substrate-binding protein n=1 Tax=Acidisphaera sp. S103 TaxID=1747223 RepID=UPI00131D138F|nr:NrtA/SsuA/CpmA family ABC transporter substrate-binding protein [Acidisphaera sp. S103]
MYRRSLLATGAAAVLAPGAKAASRETDTVRLTWGFGGLPLIAKERGEFAKALAKDNIRVQWIGPFPNHAPTIQAVVGGSADFSFGGSTTPALAAILAGSPLVFTLFAVVEPRTTAIIARDGSGINSVSDLAGKTVAVNRSGLGEFILVAALEKYHVDRSKVKVVYLNPPEAAPAFGSGQVDAWAMWSPGVDLARTQYKGHDIFLEGRDLEFQIDFNSWLTRKDFADRNRDLVAAVNAAFTTEAEWASTHPKEAETIAQVQGHYDDAIRDMFISWKRQYHIHRADDQAFLSELQRAADWLSARKVLPDKVHVADHLVSV